MATHRALVVGSQLPPLHGVNPDAQAIRHLLQDLGFEVELRVDGQACRAGILDGYRALIARTQPDDAAVFYYAGHGGYAVHSQAKPGERQRLQCIFPTDWTESGDFRGILDVELSLWMGELAGKTQNVTLLMDCCHAAEMSRAPQPVLSSLAPAEPVPRVYGAAWVGSVPAFLAAHPELELHIAQGLHVESHPSVVRMVATEADRQAYETLFRTDQGLVWRGLFSHALEQVLRESQGVPLSWQAVGQRVRECVLSQDRRQRPSVEGPAERQMFTSQRLPRTDAVVYFEQDQVPYLRANRLLGASVGAEYQVMPVGSVGYRADAVVAEATVIELVGLNARVALTLRDPGQAPLSGSPAFPKRLPYPPLPVALRGPAAAHVRALLASTDRAVEVPDSTAARFEILATDPSLELYDGPDRAALPFENTDPGRNQLLNTLQRWSKAEALRALTSEGLDTHAVRVEWGRVEQGRAVRHGRGAQCHLGEHLYVTVTNQWPEPLYFAIFDVGLSGKITLLTAGSPHGRKLEPGADATLGQRDSGPLQGAGPLQWPTDVPPTVPRRESLLVIATRQWTDFQALEAGSHTRSRGANRLHALLDSVREGTLRDLSAESSENNDGFCVHRIDFDLHPTPRSPL